MDAESTPLLVDCCSSDKTVILTLSGGEILEIAADSLPAPLPSVGEQVPPPLLLQLREAAERKLIARRVFRILDRRLYPVAALREKLTREGFGTSAVNAVLADFAAKGLHSDRHFAEAFCRDTLRRRPVGRLYMKARLRRYGVSRPVAEAVVEEVLDPDLESQLALTAANQRWLREERSDDPKASVRVVRFLKSRGFPLDLSWRVTRQVAAGLLEQQSRNGEE